MAAKKKLLLIAGHGEGDPGACSIWGQEADYTRELAKLIKSSIGSRMNVTLYDTSKDCYAQSKKGNIPDYASYDMTLEVHFNAKAKKDPYGDGSQTGIGGYIHPNNAAASIARSIIDQVKALGFKEWLLDTSTGLLNLNNAQKQGAKYFLLETAFIDDGDDMAFYTANKGKFAQAIAQGVMNGLGMKSEAAQPEAETYYRVRKSKDDEKSQKFAGTKEGALNLCRTLPGYSVFDPDMECIYTNDEAEGMQGELFKGCTEEGYIEKVGPLYTEDEKNSGILACVSLAQSILETAYGQTDLAQEANNIHGMKCSLSGNVWAGTTWNGDSYYEKESPEVEDGKTVMRKSRFRCYVSIEDSIADHSAYLLNAPNGGKQRYAGIAGEKDYRKAASIIQDGGYATDPEYANKLVKIIEKWKLEKYNAGDAQEPSSGEGGKAEVFEPYLVNTTCDWLWIRKGPGKKYDTNGHIGETDGEKKDYTIVEVVNGWGRLKSGIGWISLEYTRKVG